MKQKGLLLSVWAAILKRASLCLGAFCAETSKELTDEKDSVLLKQWAVIQQSGGEQRYGRLQGNISVNIKTERKSCGNAVMLLQIFGYG